MKGMLATGRIQRPHGVDGYLRVESFSGETRHFMRLKSMVLENRGTTVRFDIEDIQKSGERVLVKLRGIDDPESGKRYSNWTVWVARRKAASRRRKEYYAADLTGCRVVLHGTALGTVEAVCENGPDAYLEVRDGQGESHLLPFTKRYFGKVDLKRRMVELREDWLTE